MSIWVKHDIEQIKDLSCPFLSKFYLNKDELYLDFCFEDSEKKLRLHFEHHIFFRKIYEGFALNTLNVSDFHNKTRLFSTSQSSLIDWFDQQSNMLFKGTYKHYVITSQDDVIEVLARNPPKVL